MCIAFSCRSGSRYLCRCYDRGQSMSEKVVISPRHQEYRFLNGTVLEEHPWIFGTAMMSLDRPLFYEACNEHGLCIAAIPFEGHAVYADRVPEGSTGIASYEMVPWVLGQCRNLAEAVSLLSGTTVLGGRFSNKIDSPPLHWLISDDTGSVAAEPLPGGLVLTRDPAEVLAHGPPLDVHLMNLGNYVHLTRRNPRNLLPDEIRKDITAKGMGAIGLPGDYSSASRFIRCCFVKFNTLPENGHESDVERMFRMMDNLSIPRGCMELPSRTYEYTRYTVCIDATDRVLYYRCYGNSQVCRIDPKRTNTEGTGPTCFERIDTPQFLYQNRGRNLFTPSSARCCRTCWCSS